MSTVDPEVARLRATVLTVTAVLAVTTPTRATVPFREPLVPTVSAPQLQRGCILVAVRRGSASPACFLTCGAGPVMSTDSLRRFWVPSRGKADTSEPPRGVLRLLWWEGSSGVISPETGESGSRRPLGLTLWGWVRRDIWGPRLHVDTRGRT